MIIKLSKNLLCVTVIFVFSACQNRICKTFDFTRLTEVDFSFYDSYSYQCNDKIITLYLESCELRQSGDGGLFPCENRFNLSFADSINMIDCYYAFTSVASSNPDRPKISFWCILNEFDIDLNIDSINDFGKKSMNFYKDEIEITKNDNCKIEHVTIENGNIVEFSLSNGDLWKLCKKGDPLRLDEQICNGTEPPNGFVSNIKALCEFTESIGVKEKE